MEPEFERGSLRSSEEEAELARSVKKFKDNSSNSSFIPPRKQVSYKESLVGDIPGAYAQAFCFDAVVDVDGESDTELEELVDGMVDVHLSKETKARIKAPWTKALIMKVFGRIVGYSYLTFKINALWKPVARMDICMRASRPCVSVVVDLATNRKIVAITLNLYRKLKLMIKALKHQVVCRHQVVLKFNKRTIPLENGCLLRGKNI